MRADTYGVGGNWVDVDIDPYGCTPLIRQPLRAATFPPGGRCLRALGESPLRWCVKPRFRKFETGVVVIYLTGLVERRVTSWAPPSTMETEETRVSLASRCRSGMVITPQLHMVDLTLYREASTLSCRGPA